MTAVSTEQVERLNIRNLEQLEMVTPALSYSSGISYAQAYIRGIGSSFTNPGREPAVATYIDGAYVTRGFGTMLDIVDPGSIQTLKGPQGTLWGRNATGGAILINTADPDNNFGGKVRVEGGNFDHQLFEGMLNAPLGDTVALRFAARYSKDGGYIRNLVDGFKFGGRENETARVKLAFHPTEGFEAVFEVQHDESKRSPGADASILGVPYCALCAFSAYSFPLKDPYTTVGNTIGKGIGGRDMSDFVNLRISSEAGGYTVGSTTSYRNTRNMETADFDFTEVPAFNLVQFSGAATFTQGFQVASNFEGPANFVAGLDYVDDRSYFDLGGFTGVVIPPRPIGAPGFLIGSNIVNTKSISGFAEGTFEPTKGLKLIIGGRYTKDNRELAGIESRSWSSFTPRAVISYDLGQTNLYASYNEGFKAGGFNTPAAAPPADTVKPEKVKSIEVGLKFASDSGRLRANLAAFNYDYKDIQVTVIDQLNGGSVLQNAAGASGRGAELDVDYKPLNSLQLFGGVSLLHARYDDYKGAQVQVVTRNAQGNPTGIAVGFVDLSGSRLVRAPDSTVFFGATISGNLGSSWAGELTVSARHTSSFDFTPGAGGPLRADEEPAYTTAQLSAKLMPVNGRYEIGFFVDNLTDETYSSFRFTTAPFGAMRYVARPRSYGLRLGYKF
jgi:iron complex outermembrane receptor protein